MVCIFFSDLKHSPQGSDASLVLCLQKLTSAARRFENRYYLYTLNIVFEGKFFNRFMLRFRPPLKNWSNRNY